MATVMCRLGRRRRLHLHLRLRLRLRGSEHLVM